MFKIIGMIVIVISTSMIGISCSEKLKKRAGELGLVCHMIEEMSILIRYKALTVYELIENLKKNSMLCTLPFLNEFKADNGLPFKTSWEENVVNIHTFMNDGDIKLLKTLGGTLGTSDIDGQLQSLEVYKADFKLLEKEAIAAYEKKAKLYRSLGLLCGMFVSIMLI